MTVLFTFNEFHLTFDRDEKGYTTADGKLVCRDTGCSGNMVRVTFSRMHEKNINWCLNTRQAELAYSVLRKVHIAL